MKRILCYGDSNTWGYTPGTGERFDENTRWTALLQKQLGEAFCVVEAGMNARTTSFSDPFQDYLNGRQALPYTLVPTKPLDCVVVSLGTNDLKYGGAAWSARGLDALLKAIIGADTLFPGSTPIFPEGCKLLVISPIRLHPGLDAANPDNVFFGKYEDSCRFAELFAPVAAAHNAEFLDASLYGEPAETDHVHMDADSHRRLAAAVAEKLQKMFCV